MNDSVRYFLPEESLPKAWYNIVADFPKPPPPALHPGKRRPIEPSDLALFFPPTLIEQELSVERYIEIPESVLAIYRQFRPSPLVRARQLERVLNTPARIYFKYEGNNPSGSHKINTAVPQVFYNKEAGKKRIVSETGAGQWGSSLAYAGALFGMNVQVFMVRVSYEQKPYRQALMETYGARCVISPSTETAAGRAVLKQHPDSLGSLGIAISEAVEMAVAHDDTNYALGSVFNHVLLHQTVVGQEAMLQLEMAGDPPDILIACAGGGSNLAGFAFPFMGAELRGGRRMRIIAVEPTSCSTLTRGRYAYDFGDTARLTPLMKMHTLGSSFMPPGSHVGGLRYHGMAPLVSYAKELGLIEARAYPQRACFAAGITFARTEGIIPAPESTHAIRAAIDEALRCKEEGRSRTIVFNLSGHGHFDMTAFSEYLKGNMQDLDLDEKELAKSLAALPAVAEPARVMVPAEDISNYKLSAKN